MIYLNDDTELFGNQRNLLREGSVVLTPEEVFQFYYSIVPAYRDAMQTSATQARQCCVAHMAAGDVDQARAAGRLAAHFDRLVNQAQETMAQLIGPPEGGK